MYNYNQTRPNYSYCIYSITCSWILPAHKIRNSSLKILLKTMKVITSYVSDREGVLEVLVFIYKKVILVLMLKTILAIAFWNQSVSRSFPEHSTNVLDFDCKKNDIPILWKYIFFV